MPVKKYKKSKKYKNTTRVRRCVQKLKQTRKIGPSIAICQYSTNQGNKTGRKLNIKKKSKRKKKRKTKTRKKKLKI
jgi:hypothetical protein